MTLSNALIWVESYLPQFHVLSFRGRAAISPLRLRRLSCKNYAHGRQRAWRAYTDILLLLCVSKQLPNESVDLLLYDFDDIVEGNDSSCYEKLGVRRQKQCKRSSCSRSLRSKNSHADISIIKNCKTHGSTATAAIANEKIIQMTVRTPSLGGQNLGAISWVDLKAFVRVLTLPC
jgi:hypothetical protein